MTTETQPHSRNRATLQRLFAEEAIDLQESSILDQVPPLSRLGVDFDKVEGMLLGLAVGDALGATTESRTPQERREAHGEIRDYLMNRHTHENRGFPTDDSQLAFWTLEQLLLDDGLIPENVANRFSRDRIFGIGATVRAFLANLKSGKPWYASGPKSAGNGVLMRIAPILIPHLKEPTAGLWADSVLCSMITHNDAGSTACCVAFVSLLWDLLPMTSPPEPTWWIDKFIEIAGPLEGETTYHPRSPFVDYDGPIHRFVDEFVRAAYEEQTPVVDACNHWYSGAYLLETMPSVLYILMEHGHDPEEAIVRAVNDTRDNDTVAAIVGAAVGALHGRDAIPQRWVENHSGRTTDRDDGRMFELIEDARRRWDEHPTTS
jgi:ADP-ribosyl-[dinitrogen reductase] hydrolase